MFLRIFQILLVITLAGWPLSMVGAEQNADQVNELFRRGTDHYFKGNYRTALRIFKMVEQQRPDHPQAYSYSGDIYFILKDYKKAEEYFLIALELSPDKSREYFRLGQTYFQMRKGPEARKAFTMSLRENPRAHKNRFYLGLVYYRLFADREKTIKAWKEYRKLVPDDPQGPEIDLAIRQLESPDFVMPPPLKPDSDQGEGIQANAQQPVKPEHGDGAAGNGKGNGSGKTAAGECRSPSCMEIPEPEGTRVPYKNGEAEKEKTNNDGSSVISIDDL